MEVTRSSKQCNNSLEGSHCQPTVGRHRMSDRLRSKLSQLLHATKRNAIATSGLHCTSVVRGPHRDTTIESVALVLVFIVYGHEEVVLPDAARIVLRTGDYVVALVVKCAREDLVTMAFE